MPKPPLTYQPPTKPYKLPDGPLTPPEMWLNYAALVVGIVCVVILIVAKGA